MKRAFSLAAIFSLLFGKSIAQEPITPPISFYTLKFNTISGEKIDFNNFKGKMVLIVNTASKCGYTPQFDDLEKLHQQYKDRLIVIGFPSNDFAQDPGSNEKIAEFCRINYGVTFQMMEKSAVTGKDKNPVYQWLTDKTQNGWNEQQPTWNFCKYLIDSEGRLIGFYPSKIKPLDKQITDKIK